MPQRVIGLDLGTASVKAVVLKSTFRGFDVVQFAEVPLASGGPAPTSEAYAAALRELHGTHRITGETVVAAIPAHQVFLRTLTLPFTDRRKLAQVVPFELEGHLPCPLEDVVVDFHPIGQEPGETRVLAAAAPVAQVAPLLGLLGEAGWDPAILDLDGLAVSHLFRYFLPDAQSVYALLDIGAAKSTVVVMDGGEARWIRAIPLAGHALTQGLQDRLDLGFAEAEAVKRGAAIAGTAADLPAEQARRAGEALAAAFDPLLREIQQTLEAFEQREGKPVVEAYLLGGSARLRGLPAHLSKALEIPVATLDQSFWHSAGLPRFAEPEMATLPQAFGLALRVMAGSRLPKLNFRRGPFAREQERRATRGKMVALGALAGAALLLGAADLWLKYEDTGQRLNDLNAQVRRLYREAFPGGGAVTNELVQARTRLDELRKRAAQFGLAAGPEVSALEILRELSSRIPREVRVDVQELVIEQAKVRLRAETESFDAADRIKAELLRDPRFKDVRISDAKAGVDQKKVIFQLTFALADGKP